MDIDEIFNSKAEYYDTILTNFNEYRAGAYSTNLTLLKWVADFSIFTLMGAFDLWIAHCDFYKSVKSFQRNYYSRQSALIIFELFNGIPKYFSMGENEYFTELFEKRIQDKSISEDFKVIRKEIGRLKNKEQRGLKEVRNLVAAHRERDLSKAISVLNKMNEDSIQQLSLSLLKKIDTLHSVLNRCISHIYHDGELLGKEKFLSFYAISSDLKE